MIHALCSLHATWLQTTQEHFCTTRRRHVKQKHKTYPTESCQVLSVASDFKTRNRVSSPTYTPYFGNIYLQKTYNFQLKRPWIGPKKKWAMGSDGSGNPQWQRKNLLQVAATEAILPNSSHPPSPRPIPAPKNPWFENMGKTRSFLFFSGKTQYYTLIFSCQPFFQEHGKPPPRCNTKNNNLQSNMFFPKVTCFIQQICCFSLSRLTQGYPSFRRDLRGSRYLFVISERHA